MFYGHNGIDGQSEITKVSKSVYVHPYCFYIDLNEIKW